MRFLQRTDDLPPEPDCIGRRQRTAQRLTFEVLQHQVVRANVVDLADVRVIQRRDGVRLLLEAITVRADVLLDGD